MTEQNCKQLHGKQPISRHPLFSATVVLWFSALFVLASLALRPALLEKLVLAAQIDALVPAAAPPLGATVRILLALTMAGIGGLLGALVARRMTGPKPVVRKRGDDAMIANEEVPRRLGQSTIAHRLEVEGSGGKGQFQEDSASHHSTLAIAGKESGLGEYGYARPSSGERQALDPQVLDVAEVGLRSFDAAGEGEDAEDVDDVMAASRDDNALDLVGYASVVFEALRDTSDVPVPVSEQPSAVAPQGEDEGEASQNGSGAFGSPMDEPVVNASVEDEDVIAAACEGHADKASDFGPADPCAAERIASTELSELSHVELLERLAFSLERRRRSAATSAQGFASDDEGELEAQVLEDGYNSLLDLKRQAPADETPDERRSSESLVAARPRNGEEIERALRVALANLQKLSKAV